MQKEKLQRESLEMKLKTCSSLPTFSNSSVSLASMGRSMSNVKLSSSEVKGRKKDIVRESSTDTLGK
jgi:predicted aspartyl protease